jgi:hypothetical protein
MGFLWLLAGMILAGLEWSDSDRWAWVRGVLTLVRGSCILGLSSRANVSNDGNGKIKNDYSNRKASKD